MTVILIPIGRADAPDDWLQVNWWNWRPTLALLRAHALLEHDKLERMGVNGTGVQVTADEVDRIATFLEEYLRGMGPLSGGVSPRDGAAFWRSISEGWGRLIACCGT